MLAKWHLLSRDRRSAWFGAAGAGVAGLLLVVFSSSWSALVGSVLLAFALILVVAALAASDGRLRKVLGIVNLPWPL